MSKRQSRSIATFRTQMSLALDLEACEARRQSVVKRLTFSICGTGRHMLNRTKQFFFTKEKQPSVLRVGAAHDRSFHAPSSQFSRPVIRA
jgi:hypothetical protein